MKRNSHGWLIGIVAALVVAGGATAQGWRGGPGPRGDVATPRPAQTMRGAGGWWNRATPNTPQQRALVEQAAALQDRIRSVRQEAYTLRLRNAPAAQVQAKDREAANLQEQMRQLVAKNQTALQEMGVPAGYGACDGIGPRGAGMGYGRGGGMGRGNGMRRGGGMGMGYGLRDGSGPNPYCPLRPGS